MLNDFCIHIPLTIIGMGKSNDIGNLVKKRGANNIIIITDNNILKIGLINNIKASLEKEGYGFDIFSDCEVHAPSHCVEKCSEFVRTGNYDLLIGVGGGSVMDTVKAVSVIAPNNISFDDFLNGKNIRNVLEKILVPTTAGTGSEWSRTGVYYDNVKGEERLVFENRLFADAVIIDPELMLNLPQRVTAESGLDALTHAIEAYTNSAPNIVADTFCEASIKLISENLRLAYVKGAEHPEARYKMSIASSMAMNAVAMNGAGMAHFLNPQIGKKTGTPHGEACILMLPHTMEFNLIACPERFARIAELMGERIEGLHIMDAAKKAIGVVKQISKDVGMPQTLTEIGISKDDITEMVDATLENFQSRIKAKNPRQATREDIIGIYSAAL